MEETGAFAEWRCSSGDGPIDQCRVTYEVEIGMRDFLANVTKADRNQKKLGDNADGTEDRHMIAEMPFPLCARECVIRRLVEANDETCWIITRTYPGSDARTVTRNPLRVLIDVHIAGYFLEALSPNRTKVIYLVGTNLNGIFALDWISRKASPHHLKAHVDNNMKFVREMNGEGVEEIKGALDLGSIFANNDEEEGTFEMTQPSYIQKEKERELSGVSGLLDANRQLRAASSGGVGLGGDVVAKKFKKKKKKKKKEEDVAKDKELFKRLDGGGFKKVIGVGKKGLLEVKKAPTAVDRKQAPDIKAKGRVYTYNNDNNNDNNNNDDDDDDDNIRPPSTPAPIFPPPTWEKHKDEESGEFYFHNMRTNETTWEDPNKTDTF